METNQTTADPSNSLEYAGFWLRLAAHIIDHFIVGFVLGSIVSFTMLIMGISASIFGDLDNPANQMIFMSFTMVIGVAALVITWLYYAMMECSSYQGTLGKMALSIKVTDMEGGPVTFAQATGRFFAKFISSLILYFGYFMIGFTQKKQGLHDILASCLVVRK